LRLKKTNEFIKTPPKTVLIVLFGAIGDVVRAFPLLSQIKENWPNAKITWAVETPSVGIVQDCKFVDKAIEFKRKNGFSAYLKLISEIRKEKYDLVIDLQRHLKSGFTSFVTRSPVRVGFSKKNSREGNFLFNNYYIEKVQQKSDKIEQYLKFAEFFGFKKIEKRYDFGLEEDVEVSSELEKKIKQILIDHNLDFYPKEKRVLLFIGSTWETKIWPSLNFANLARSLFQEHGLLPILVGSNSDVKKAIEIKSLVDFPVLDLVGSTTLKEFKNLCFNAQFAVACDSGPMHIACAVGLPVISIWGPTSPIRSKPYLNSKYVIQSPIGCRECYLRTCPGLDTICLSDIGAEVVMGMIKSNTELTSAC